MSESETPNITLGLPSHRQLRSLVSTTVDKETDPRPGRRLHVVAEDTCLQQVYERPPTSLSSSGDAARVPPWAIAPPGSPTSTQNTHTHTHTRTSHSVPGGKQPGARSAAHPARRGWEGGQTTTTTTTRD